MAVDLLSDVLKLVRLAGALMFRVDIHGPWGIAGHPTLEKFAPLLSPSTSHVIALYVVLEGECWTRHGSCDWFAVPAGRAVVIAHGGCHDLCDQPGRKMTPFASMLEGRSLLDVRHIRFGTETGRATSLLCGFLGCDRRAFEPLCSSLPPVFQVDLKERMQTLVRYAVTNALDDTPGAAGLRERLAELLFLGALRIYLGNLPADATGWLAGLRDPVVGHAMQAMHAQPCRHWSVEELAAAAASSRSALAARFTHVLGEPPMRYLTRLRMHLAARELSDSRKSLATVAAEVGYESPSAFQRAFKRRFAMPAAAWRKSTASRADASRGAPRRGERRLGDRRLSVRDVDPR